MFLPGSISRPEWIKSLSSGLRPTEATLINADIDNGLIRVVKDQEAMLGRTRVPPTGSQPDAGSLPEEAGNYADSASGMHTTRSGGDPTGSASAEQLPPPPRRKKQPKHQAIRRRRQTKRARVEAQLTAEEMALDDTSTSDLDSETACIPS